MYTVGSELITFSPNASANIAGTTATRWYVKGPDGRKIVSGLASEEDAEHEATLIAHGAELTPVTLINGATVEIPFDMLDSFAGLDAEGNWVINDEYVGLVPLTPCCHATGTGDVVGVVCRACYHDVSDYFGGSAVVSVPRVEA